MRKLLFAFDLDGTLLNSDKEISKKTISAIQEMHSFGHIIVLASGRIGSSLMKYENALGVPFSTVSLNGAAAYEGGAGNSNYLFQLPLQKEYSSQLISFYKNKSKSFNGEDLFSINFYNSDKLYTEESKRESEWVKLYIKETASEFNFVSSIDELIDLEPEKILFCGKPDILDSIEEEFVDKWSEDVYIVRTWDRYLEFLHKNVNKAIALEKVAASHDISMKDVVAFGDGDNDSPMLKAAGFGIAVQNGTSKAKLASNKVSEFNNDQDVIAKEWDILKRNYEADSIS